MFKDQLITALLSSPIVYIPHYDYEAIDDALKEILEMVDLKENAIAEYDLYKGWVYFNSKRRDGDNGPDYKDIHSWLDAIVEAKNMDKEHVFLCKNCQQETLENLEIQSILQNFAAKYKHGDYKGKGDIYSIVIVSPMPVSLLPIGLEKILTVIDYPTPKMEEVRAEINKIPIAPSVLRRQDENSFREELTNALLGLQMYEVKQVLRSVLVRSKNKQLKMESKSWALEEKQQIVKKTGIIEVLNPDVRLDDVGGLKKLKEDIKKKAIIYKHLNDAQRKGINLPIPKGCLILGMPGCGKSLIAKAIASEFDVSLLRLDVNRLMGQYVGMSEENLRRALQTAETAHPCVLWIDEVEKAFAGAGAGSGNGDGDMLVQRLLGQFLTWMQERKTAVYIVATANDVMRPEFMRKGRFDEVYFVDFPNLEERKAILEAKLKRFGFLSAKDQYIYDFTDFIDEGKPSGKVEEVAKLMVAGAEKKVKKEDAESSGFSGAEIESVVNQVMENAFIKYQEAIDNKHPLPQIKITFDGFKDVIDVMRPSVIANQVTSEEEKKKNPNKKTNIERIRELQSTYKFKNASK